MVGCVAVCKKFEGKRKKKFDGRTFSFEVDLTEKASLVFVLDGDVDEDGDDARVMPVQGPRHLPDASDERLAVRLVPMFGGCRVERRAILPSEDSTMDH